MRSFRLFLFIEKILRRTNQATLAPAVEGTSRRDLIGWLSRILGLAALGRSKAAQAFPTANVGAFWQVINTDVAAGYWAMGLNSNGEFGINTTISTSSPVQMLAGNTWTKIVTGSGGTVIARRSDGTLWSWGDYLTGTLGYSGFGRSSPTQIGSLTTWSDVACGVSTAMAIQTDGTLWVWGDNSAGLNATVHYADASSPIQIGSATNWSKVSNNTHAVAVRGDGTLWTWGDNQYGQLGTGVAAAAAFISSPTQIGSLTTWSKVNGTFQGSFAIKTDHTLWAWGRGDGGEHGLSDVAARSSPVQLGAATTYAQVSGGSAQYATVLSTLALMTDGTLWAMGPNAQGQLGVGDVVARSSPVQIGSLTTWSDVSSSAGWHTLALKTDGTLWVWGNNGGGQLGRGTVVSTSSPVQVGALTTWTNIAAGSQFSLARRSDGTIWGWGNGAGGVLGLGNITNYSSPVQIGSDTTWSKVFTRANSSFGLKADGTLWSWGINGVSQLGLGDAANRSSPVQVGTATNWATISAGPFHTLGIKTDGTLWSWGWVNLGRLGYSGTGVSPVQVGTLTTWSDISAQTTHSVAVHTDGTLWAWGDNTMGELGLGTCSNVNVLQQVGTDTNWAEGIAGNIYSLALKMDGTLWAWGNNSAGQLAKGDKISRSSPVQVGSLTTWAQIVTLQGATYTVTGRTSTGTLWSWGSATYGSAGWGIVVSRSSPVQIGALTNWSKIAAGVNHVGALRGDGTLWGWGRNVNGNLAQGDTADRSSPVQIGASTNWADVWAGENLVVGKAQ